MCVNEMVLSLNFADDWILLTYKNGDTYGGHCGGEARQAHIMLLCNTKTLVVSLIMYLVF